MELPNIQTLRSFVIYGRLGNFTLAAKEANATQSAFSAQIKKLEIIVGVPLIRRDNKGSSLTAEGEIFSKEATRILSALEQAVVSTQTMYDSRRPELHVAVMRSMGDVVMNTHIAYFKKHHPDFVVNVYDMEEEEIISDLYAERVDVAFVYITDMTKWEAYGVVPVGADRYVYFGPKLNSSDPVDREEILDLPLLRYPPKYFMETAFHEYFAGRHAREEIQLSNPYAMIDYCRRNRAGFLLSERLAESTGIRRKCKDLRQGLKLPLYLVHKKDHVKQPYIDVFSDYLQKKSFQ